MRRVATAVVVAVVVALVAAVPPAAADGVTPVGATCTGLPIVGSASATVNVTANDSVDPVAPGGNTTNTIEVPVPATDDLPVSATITEVKLTIKIPAQVQVTAVNFTSSSFSGQTWQNFFGYLIVTLTGSVPVGGGNPPPTVPMVSVVTKVNGVPRTVEWKVPEKIEAKANAGIFGNFTATCVPDDLSTVLISTVVANPNTAPTATDQNLATPRNTAKAITLSGTDPQANPLTFAVATQPAHGDVTGTPPNVTYTPDTDFVGLDSFTFTASDGSLSDTGTVHIDVTNSAPTATDQNLATARNTAKAITLSGTDPESNPLTFAVATQPAHGDVTGTPPNVTYTPDAGFVGSDNFTFTASDGLLADTGTVQVTVEAVVPGAPSITSVVPGDGEATVRWSAPSDDGGSAVTGYDVVPVVGGVQQAPIAVGPTPTERIVTGLTDGTAYTFVVKAKNAKGTGPASASSSAVTPANCAPYPSCTAAVNDLYTKLLGRSPTTAERTAAVNQLNGGTLALQQFVASFRLHADHLNNVDPVTRLYRAYFLRIPDKGGLTHWIGQRRAGKSKDAISQSFAGSNEFKTRYGTLTNLAFVNLVYANVLGRPGEPLGVAFWTSELDSGKRNRGQVMAGFSESTEYKNKQAAEVTSSVYWILLLGRSPTTAEFDAAVAQLEGGGTAAQLARTLLRSVEFAGLVD